MKIFVFVGWGNCIAVDDDCVNILALCCCPDCWGKTKNTQRREKDKKWKSSAAKEQKKIEKFISSLAERVLKTLKSSLKNFLYDLAPLFLNITSQDGLKCWIKKQQNNDYYEQLELGWLQSLWFIGNQIFASSPHQQQAKQSAKQTWRGKTMKTFSLAFFFFGETLNIFRERQLKAFRLLERDNWFPQTLSEILSKFD